jgi:stage V sporulation protein AC
MTKEEYVKFAEKLALKSPSGRNILMAFLTGGTVCLIGQTLQNLYAAAGMTRDSASACVSVTLIFIGALLTGLHIFDNIAKVAGAGTLVPITGFANAIVSPAMEFKSEGLIMGLSARMFTIAGPVLVFGISASAIYGLILVLIQQSIKN